MRLNRSIMRTAAVHIFASRTCDAYYMWLHYWDIIREAYSVDPDIAAHGACLHPLFPITRYSELSFHLVEPW